MQSYVRAMIAGLAAPHLLGSQASNHVRCDVVASWRCLSSGCTAAPVPSQYLLIPDRGDLSLGAPVLARRQEVELQRCNLKGCRLLNAVASERGSFLFLTDPLGGYFLKISLSTVPGASQRGVMVEVNAVGQEVTTRFGLRRLPKKA